jgi:hypothetical protein
VPSDKWRRGRNPLSACEQAGEQPRALKIIVVEESVGIAVCLHSFLERWLACRAASTLRSCIRWEATTHRGVGDMLTWGMTYPCTTVVAETDIGDVCDVRSMLTREILRRDGECDPHRRLWVAPRPNQIDMSGLAVCWTGSGIVFACQSSVAHAVSSVDRRSRR